MTQSVRPATWADLHDMATVFTESFKNEDMLGRFQHPHRFEHWDDYVSCWYRNLRQKLCDPTVRAFVSVEVGTGKVTGLAIWERWGEGAKKMRQPFMLSE
jgi:hypothetical protein